MNILVLEDDLETAAALRAGLVREGHEVVLAEGVAAAQEAIGSTAFDAAILDVSLPDGSGYSVLSALRAKLPQAIAVMLTARGAVEDRVQGLDRGADDYLVKPFAFAELAARLRALSRRPRQEETHLSIGDLELDTTRRTASAKGIRLDLTPIEFGLLVMLIRLRGEVVTRGELLREVWGYDFDPATNVVDVHVNRVRRKLESSGIPNFIRTLRGEGYSVDA